MSGMHIPPPTYENFRNLIYHWSYLYSPSIPDPSFLLAHTPACRLAPAQRTAAACNAAVQCLQLL